MAFTLFLHPTMAHRVRAYATTNTTTEEAGTGLSSTQHVTPPNAAHYASSVHADGSKRLESTRNTRPRTTRVDVVSLSGLACEDDVDGNCRGGECWPDNERDGDRANIGENTSKESRKGDSAHRYHAHCCARAAEVLLIHRFCYV